MVGSAKVHRTHKAMRHIAAVPAPSGHPGTVGYDHEIISYRSVGYENRSVRAGRHTTFFAGILARVSPGCCAT